MVTNVDILVAESGGMEGPVSVIRWDDRDGINVMVAYRWVCCDFIR
jgi:hypothetical protein